MAVALSLVLLIDSCKLRNVFYINRAASDFVCVFYLRVNSGHLRLSFLLSLGYCCLLGVALSFNDSFYIVVALFDFYKDFIIRCLCVLQHCFWLAAKAASLY